MNKQKKALSSFQLSNTWKEFSLEERLSSECPQFRLSGNISLFRIDTFSKDGNIGEFLAVAGTHSTVFGVKKITVFIFNTRRQVVSTSSIMMSYSYNKEEFLKDCIFNFKRSAKTEVIQPSQPRWSSILLSKLWSNNV